MRLEINLEAYDEKANFWQMFPTFKVAGVTKELYDSDTSKGKQNSSKMMWFVAFCYEMIKNRYYNLSVDERHTLIGRDICGDEKYYNKNKVTLDKIIEFYCNLQDTPAMAQLRTWNLKMQEKTKFLRETAYGPDTYQMIDAMFKSDKDSYINYEQILKKLSVETSTEAKGGSRPSLSDEGEI